MSDFLKKYISDGSASSAPRPPTHRQERSNKHAKKEEPKKETKEEFKTRYKVNNTDVIAPVELRGKRVKEITIPKFEIRSRAFARKSTVLYGTSGSGKTYLIKDIMYGMRHKFARVWVFCPTNIQNHMYDYIVPNPLIFDKVTLKNIKDIYEFQKTARSIFDLANNLATLRRLFLKVASYKAKVFEQQLIDMEKMAVRKIRESTSDPVKLEEKIEQVDEIMKDRLRRHYKSVIGQRIEKLRCMDLNEKEKYSLRYYNFNPDSLVIFDDAMMEVDRIVKKGKKEEDPVVQNFFFKGRHLFITAMYAMQSDKMLDPDLRKNAHNTIFTSQDEALSFFSKKTSNGISNEEQRDANAAIKVLFGKSHAKTFKKLVYMKDSDKKYQYVVAQPRPRFPMCSPIIREYCKKVEQKGSNIDRNSKFFKRFAEYSRNN